MGQFNVAELASGLGPRFVVSPMCVLLCMMLLGTRTALSRAWGTAWARAQTTARRKAINILKSTLVIKYMANNVF